MAELIEKQQTQKENITKIANLAYQNNTHRKSDGRILKVKSELNIKDHDDINDEFKSEENESSEDYAQYSIHIKQSSTSDIVFDDTSEDQSPISISENDDNDDYKENQLVIEAREIAKQEVGSYFGFMGSSVFFKKLIQSLGYDQVKKHIDEIKSVTTIPITSRLRFLFHDMYKKETKYNDTVKNILKSGGSQLKSLVKSIDSEVSDKTKNCIMECDGFQKKVLGIAKTLNLKHRALAVRVGSKKNDDNKYYPVIRSKTAEAMTGLPVGWDDHYAVEVIVDGKRMVFDNLNPCGKPYKQWADDLVLQHYLPSKKTDHESDILTCKGYSIKEIKPFKKKCIMVGRSNDKTQKSRMLTLDKYKSGNSFPTK